MPSKKTGKNKTDLQGRDTGSDEEKDLMESNWMYRKS